jgi:hypothetical protein
VLEFDVDRVIDRYERLYAEIAGAA